MSLNKAKRLRFTYEDDLALLREFLNVNPTINPQGWEIIQNNVEITTGKPFLIRTLKQHIMLLIEMWLKKMKVDQIRSGVEEPQCERNALLEEVHSLCRENNYMMTEKKRPLSKDQQISNLGKQLREECATSSFYEKYENTPNEKDVSSEVAIIEVVSNAITDHQYAIADDQNIDHTETIRSEILMNPRVNHTPALVSQSYSSAPTPTTKETTKVLEPSRKRLKREPLGKNALAYLNEKGEKENNIRLMELEIEKRKVAVAEKRIEIDERKIQVEEKKILLEERRLEMEFKERLARLDIEKSKNEEELKQRKVTNQLIASQQQLIDTLLREKNIN